VYPGHLYYSKPSPASPSLLLGYGSIQEENIEPRVKRLAELVRAVS